MARREWQRQAPVDPPAPQPQDGRGHTDSTLSLAIPIRRPCRCVSVPAPVYGLSKHLWPAPALILVSLTTGAGSDTIVLC